GPTSRRGSGARGAGRADLARLGRADRSKVRDEHRDDVPDVDDERQDLGPGRVPEERTEQLTGDEDEPARCPLDRLVWQDGAQIERTGRPDDLDPVVL